MSIRAGFLPLIVWAACAVAAGAQGQGFNVPDGFEVSLFAGDDLAHDIYSMTIDAQGRVVVAGRGYVKILHDDNRDGRADRATLFSDRPKSGAHGMYFDGPDLICTGDDSVMKLRDTNGDGLADGAPEIWTRLRHPEHGANGVVKGPDGWIYIICGNDAEVNEKHASTPYSPVKKPNCGAVVRIAPDGKQSEVFADGFRNPYDLDFNERGHLFTVDADGERDQYLPWYAPTRLFDVAQGRHHGWVLRGWTRSWNRPAYFFDSVERVLEIGRGSPTGLLVYRHRQFPKEYRGGVFSACWTLGTIYHLPLAPSGSSYTSKKEVFMQTTGQIGFAPVDLAVGPEGDLFVAIGGRGTQGSVFRVRYTKTPLPKQPQPPKDDNEALVQVLHADQPLASWSRARWVPMAKRLGDKAFLKDLRGFANDASRDVRSIEVLTELFDGLPADVIERLAKTKLATVRARTAWALGANPTLYFRDRRDRLEAFAIKLEKELPGILNRLPVGALREFEGPWGGWSSLWHELVNDPDNHVARASCEAIVSARVPAVKIAERVTLETLLVLPEIIITRQDIDPRLREAWLAVDTGRLRRVSADQRKNSVERFRKYFSLPSAEAEE
ncbi:MAG: PVC-type heme-binding CxxCH protein, partial [Pirellulales bacterium]